jgi:hypothetical protein
MRAAAISANLRFPVAAGEGSGNFPLLKAASGSGATIFMPLIQLAAGANRAAKDDSVLGEPVEASPMEKPCRGCGWPPIIVELLAAATYDPMGCRLLLRVDMTCAAERVVLLDRRLALGAIEALFFFLGSKRGVDLATLTLVLALPTGAPPISTLSMSSFPCTSIVFCSF